MSPKSPLDFHFPATRQKDKGGQVYFRKKEILVPIITWTPASVGTTATVTIVIKNPSRRLSLIAGLFLKARGNDGGKEGNYVSNATWAISGAVIAENTILTPLNNIVSAALDPARMYELPNSYEFDTAIDVIVISVNMAALPQYMGASDITNGEWYLRCAWEPNTPFDDERELEALFGLCAVSAPKVSIE